MIILTASLGRDKSASLTASLRKLGMPAGAVSQSRLAGYADKGNVMVYFGNVGRIGDETVSADKAEIVAFTSDEPGEVNGITLLRWNNAARAAGIISTRYVFPSPGLLNTENGRIMYHKTELPLTFTERLIVTALAEKNGEYVSVADLALFCTAEGSETSVISYVSSINKKALPLTGHKLIQCKRFRGYTINEK